MGLRDRLFGPRAPQRHAALGSGPDPWTVNGLPFGLTEQDISAAAHALMTHAPAGRVRPLGADAATPITSALLYGTQYVDNRRRISALAQLPLIAPKRVGRRGYPGIFVPDPSTSDSDVRPLAVIGPTGYVGSVWNEAGTEMRKAVEAALNDGLVYATLVEVDGDQVRAWLPSWTARQSDAGTTLRPATVAGRRTPTTPGRPTLAKTGDRLAGVAAGKVTVAGAESLGASLEELVTRLKRLSSDALVIGDEAAGRLLSARLSEFGLAYAAPATGAGAVIKQLSEEIQGVADALDELVRDWPDADREERQDLKDDAGLYAEELVKHLADGS